MQQDYSELVNDRMGCKSRVLDTKCKIKELVAVVKLFRLPKTESGVSSVSIDSQPQVYDWQLSGSKVVESVVDSKCKVQELVSLAEVKTEPGESAASTLSLPQVYDWQLRDSKCKVQKLVSVAEVKTEPGESAASTLSLPQVTDWKCDSKVNLTVKKTECKVEDLVPVVELTRLIKREPAVASSQVADVNSINETTFETNANTHICLSYNHTNTSLCMQTTDCKPTAMNIENNSCKYSLKETCIITQETEKTDLNLFRCKTCRKTFYQKSNLIKHKLVHTKKKPFQCESCKKSFSQKSVLSRHQLVHTVVKTFQCETCKKLFSLKSNLSKHQLVHTGSKPFQCETCKKPFSNKSHLIQHQLVHTEKKPYQCETCKKSFSLKSNLSKHQLVHTEKKPINVRLVRNHSLLKATYPNIS